VLRHPSEIVARSCVIKRAVVLREPRAIVTRFRLSSRCDANRADDARHAMDLFPSPSARVGHPASVISPRRPEAENHIVHQDV